MNEQKNELQVIGLPSGTRIVHVAAVGESTPTPRSSYLMNGDPGQAEFNGTALPALLAAKWTIEAILPIGDGAEFYFFLLPPLVA